MDETPMDVIEVDDRTVSKRSWRLTLTPESLLLATPEGGPGWQVRRADVPRAMTLVRIGGSHLLTVRLPGAPGAIAVDGPTYERLWAWRGPLDGRDLRHELGAAFWMRLVVGSALALLSLPMDADPLAGIEATPLDPVGIALGTGLVALALAGRLRPHPVQFLLEAVWCLVLAADCIVDVVRGESHVAFLLFVPLLAAVIWYRLRQEARMRHVRVDRSAGTERPEA